MLNKKSAIKDFVTENITFLIILLVALALLIILYFTKAFSSDAFSNTTTSFGKSLFDILGGSK